MRTLLRCKAQNKKYQQQGLGEKPKLYCATEVQQKLNAGTVACIVKSLKSDMTNFGAFVACLDAKLILTGVTHSS